MDAPSEPIGCGSGRWFNITIVLVGSSTAQPGPQHQQGSIVVQCCSHIQYDSPKCIPCVRHSGRSEAAVLHLWLSEGVTEGEGCGCWLRDSLTALKKSVLCSLHSPGSRRGVLNVALQSCLFSNFTYKHTAEMTAQRAVVPSLSAFGE